jgi:hypothetical protein
VIHDSNSKTLAVFFPQPAASKAVICVWVLVWMAE